MTAPMIGKDVEVGVKTITNAFKTITNDYISKKTITRITL